MLDITVQLDKTIGTMRPLQGVNNGPICYGSLVDASAHYRELQVPWVRLHDCNWPHPREVDIHTIFPDFNKDPDDPASYDFARTDVYLKSIIDIGAKIVYRLGESIEHTPQKYYIHPPADFAKWARICLGIIRHYNQGWAQGFHYAIQHWEIWNEPESLPDSTPQTNAMWSGTHEQYFELYKTTALAIKSHDPSLQVGGYAATMMQPEFMVKFLRYCQMQQLPLDFFSWHTYANKPEHLANNAREVRRLLDEHGYTKSQSHCNEWNYVPALSTGKDVFRAGNELSTREFFERSKSAEGASYDAAILMLMQDLPIDVANFYDGAPSSWWSLFDCYGVPQKNFYAFKAFVELCRLPHRVGTAIVPDASGLYGCGAKDDVSGAFGILLSNPVDTPGECRLTISATGKPQLPVELLLVDATHNLTAEPTLLSRSDTGNMLLQLPAYSVVLLKGTTAR